MDSFKKTLDTRPVSWGPPPERGPSGAANILVVDDDQGSLLAMAEILDGIGDRVVCAASGEDALRCLLREDFAIVLLDVVMTSMTGYEIAELIRQRERSRYVPIIFMSAMRKDEHHMFQGYSAGAVDYVFKPVDPTIVRSKVSVFVELHRKAENEKRLLAENLRVRTEQIRTAQALGRSQAQQSLVIDALPIAFYVAGVEEGFTERRYVGGRTRPICGFRAERFEHEPRLWFDRIHEADREEVQRGLARLLETGDFYAEYRWRCGDGSWRHFLDHGKIVTKGGNKPVEMFGTWLDVTDRRMLEQQLAHAQKMEALGQLTGGIAHDFNNLLTVIIGSLDRLQKAAEPRSAMARNVELALQGALSCADLTRRLLAFARRQPLQPKVLDLNQELERLHGLLERSLRADMQVRQCCSADLWPVVADATQIEAALINLLANARDAMPDGGAVTISTRNRALDAPAAAAAKLSPGEYVELSVADTGIGMPPKTLEHALDPFFTTKPAGKGTGLGLSTIYGFLRQSNGGIEIESSEGQGTTVRLYLPRAVGTEVSAASALLAAGQPDIDGQKVLVVEDDCKVRGMTVAMLRDLGCVVVEAADGPAALALLQSDSGISLLFTDCVMPGMNGRQLASEATKLRPNLNVLYTSAHSDEFFSSSQASANGSFLSKPYRQDELAEAVRTALAASSTER